MRRAGALGAAAAMLALGIFVERSAGTAQPPRVAVGDLLVGVILGWCGIAAVLQAPRRAAGWLLALSGVLWLVATLQLSHNTALSDVGAQVGLAYRGPLVCAVLLACCSPRSPLTIGTAVFGWVDALVTPVGDSDWAAVALAAAVVASMLLAPRRERRPAPAVLLAVGLAGPALFTIGGQPVDVGNRVLLGADLAIGLCAVTTLMALIAERRSGERMADRLIDLAGAASIDAAIAEALDEPGVRVLAPEVGSEPVAPGRERTPVTSQDGAVVALVEHAIGALADPALRSGVLTAVLLQHDQERRRAELARAAEGIQAAQRRMVLAADGARARLQRRLERDAIPRAERICEHLATTPATVEVAQTLDRAIEQLRVLAAGLHPLALTKGGLRAALIELARGAPLDVHVAAPERRYAQEVELVLYYTCAEALANAIKHAQARSVQIDVADAGTLVRAQVVDDGVGGARLGAGSGLGGLFARTAAVGGRIAVDSPPGAGTRVAITVPT
jgi:hypothetical protein